jgi:hypothetical protein
MRRVRSMPTERGCFRAFPGLERARNGRLWAVWYAGGPDEPTEGPGNYVVLVTSGDDGRTWSGPKLVLDPPGDVRAYDSTLWHDPQGRLWLYWAQSSHKWDGRSGVWEMHTDNSGEAAPKWSEPRRLADGIMMNKPTALKSGAWLFPSSVWAEKPGPGTRPEHRRDLGALVGANVFVSSDRGRTVTHLGQTRATDSIFDEHMVVERRRWVPVDAAADAIRDSGEHVERWGEDMADAGGAIGDSARQFAVFHPPAAVRRAADGATQPAGPEDAVAPDGVCQRR